MKHSIGEGLVAETARGVVCGSDERIALKPLWRDASDVLECIGNKADRTIPLAEGE
jgi:hypothetical protein